MFFISSFFFFFAHLLCVRTYVVTANCVTKKKELYSIRVMSKLRCLKFDITEDLHRFFYVYIYTFYMHSKHKYMKKENKTKHAHKTKEMFINCVDLDIVVVNENQRMYSLIVGYSVGKMVVH